MKRMLLFSLILSFGLVSFAQKSSFETKEQRQVQKTAVHNAHYRFLIWETWNKQVTLTLVILLMWKDSSNWAYVV